MRIVLMVAASLALGACVAPEAREASCKCFSASGAATGNCQFQRVAGAPLEYGVTK